MVEQRKDTLRILKRLQRPVKTVVKLALLSGLRHRYVLVLGILVVTIVASACIVSTQVRVVIWVVLVTRAGISFVWIETFLIDVIYRVPICIGIPVPAPG